MLSCLYEHAFIGICAALHASHMHILCHKTYLPLSIRLSRKGEVISAHFIAIIGNLMNNFEWELVVLKLGVGLLDFR